MSISQILICTWLTLLTEQRLCEPFTLHLQLTISKTRIPTQRLRVDQRRAALRVRVQLLWRAKSPQTPLTPSLLRWASTSCRTSSRLCSSPSPSFIPTRARERACWRASRDHPGLLQTGRPAVLAIAVRLHQNVKDLLAHSLMRPIAKSECSFSFCLGEETFKINSLRRLIGRIRLHVDSVFIVTIPLCAQPSLTSFSLFRSVIATRCSDLADTLFTVGSAPYVDSWVRMLSITPWMQSLCTPDDYCPHLSTLLLHWCHVECEHLVEPWAKSNLTERA